ncbi:Shikimate kinase [bioreactor metagenome]|uniref:Shikimate kinase n=1 Tax=bioreactor metagenome TaxID=1076179 RepID=A0A645I5E1_9ZZZZ
MVATGGSVVYSKKAMDSLRHAGRTVYLDVPFREIEKRLKNITGRGIVITGGKGLKDVYAERVPLYQKYGEITVRCAHRDIEGCVREIARLL